jgi:hypothetical protein
LTSERYKREFTYEQWIADTEHALRRRIAAAHESFEPGSVQFNACLGTCHSVLEGVCRNIVVAPADEARLRALIERERQ